MKRGRFLPLGLVILFAALQPAAAQTAGVCNSGKVPVVAFAAYPQGVLSTEWAVFSTAVAPGQCREVFQGQSTETYLGIAVTVNGRLVGQPADALPDWGVYRFQPKLERAVKHICLNRNGETDYAEPVLEPNCPTLGTPGRYISVDTALFLRTGANVRDNYSRVARYFVVVSPTASDPHLHLRDAAPGAVDAENDARVKKMLDDLLGAAAKEASKTPEQRSAERNHAAVDNGAPWTSPRLSAAGPFDASWVTKTVVLSGTVSRVTVKKGSFPEWVTVFFNESPQGELVVCSPYPDIFFERLGANWASALTGRTIEVQGVLGGALCNPGSKGAVQVVMNTQLRIR